MWQVIQQLSAESMGDFLNSKNFKKFQDNQVTCCSRCCPCQRRAPTLLLLSAARQLRSQESNPRVQEGRTPDPPVDAPCVAVDKLLLLVGAHVTRHTSHVTRHTSHAAASSHHDPAGLL